MKLHIFLLVVVVASNLFGGMAPPVPKEQTEQFVAKSDLVFEAEFRDLKENFTYKGKILSGQELEQLQKVASALEADSEELVYRKWNDDGTRFVERVLTAEEEERNNRVGPFSPEYIGEDFGYLTVSIGEDGKQFKLSEIKILRSITLEVTKSIKGGDERANLTFDFVDSIGSSCPHFLALGRFREPQRYFLFLGGDEDAKQQVYRYQPIKNKK